MTFTPGAELARLRAAAPLVHNITNFVAMSTMANVQLAIGASPAMLHAREEVAEFAPLASALTINIGTLSGEWLAGMLDAAAAANRADRPWVLDPVAVGATSFRRRAAEQLLALGPKVIRGNASEIIALARSGGLIGLQLDERRIASKAALGQVKHSLLRHKIMHYRSGLLWRQVQHIAETLDQAGLFAWDCMAIGSDFDGIIDSLNGFWTAEELPFLSDFLERHAYNYLKTARWRLGENQIDADEVVERIFSGNGHRFLKAHFRGPVRIDIT